jgi:hydrogenase nickel incorporation protein HypA/HybF
MHELGICRNIVAIVGDAARGRRVRRVTLEVGKLAGVMSEALAFCFPVVAEGTPLAGAALDIREIAGRARCRDCGSEFEVATLMPTSCACGSRRVQRIAGEELNIKSMEIEEAA